MHHYVYRITNIQDKIHYIGSRKSKYPPDEDLGKRYFSSSSNKNFINLQKEKPELFKYKGIDTFNNLEDALKLEIELHSKFDVAANESYYNLARQTSTKYSTSGTTLSLDRRRQIGKTFKGKKQSKEHIKKRTSKIQGDGNGMYGKSYYDVWVEKYGQAEATKLYEESLNKRIRGENNPCYGKTGKDHPASKKYNIVGHNINEEYDNVKDIQNRCVELGISWNTLRLYSKQGKENKGYLLATTKS